MKHPSQNGASCGSREVLGAGGNFNPPPRVLRGTAVLTGADLFFLALKASRNSRPARMRARGVRVRMWQTHPFVCR